MNPDELRAMLKSAGRPVDQFTDPIPVIHRRARTVVRRRTMACVAALGVVAAVILNLMSGAPGLHLGEPGVAHQSEQWATGESAAFPPAAGDHYREGQPTMLEEDLFSTNGITLGTTGAGQLGIGDHLRVRYFCPRQAVQLELTLTTSLPGQVWNNRKVVPCTSSPGIVDLYTTKDWPSTSQRQVWSSRRPGAARLRQ